MTDNINSNTSTQEQVNTQSQNMTEAEVNQRFQALSQQYNILVNMIATLPVHPLFHERICDRLHDGYLRAKECFAMLALQAQGQAQCQAQEEASKSKIQTELFNEPICSA